MLKNTPWYKKVFQFDFILFALITLAGWIVFLHLTGSTLGSHSPHDQHTRQALSWQQGRIDVDNVGYLELAKYDDKIYVSFPPATTLIEFPFTLFFGLNTPNTFTLMFFTWIGMLLTFFIFLKFTENRLLSFVMAFFFYWGSNIFYLSLKGSVWHQGQLFGAFMAVMAFFLILYSDNRPGLFVSGFLLGLAVGCRPFYLFTAPFFMYQVYKKHNSINALIFFTAGMIPPGFFYGVYNFVRFGNPLEFGHRYLPYESSKEHGVFSFFYLAQNAKHAFLYLPEWNEAKGLFTFSGAGTAIWIVCPIILSGFGFFFKKDVPVVEKVIGGICLFAVWLPLLLHISGGWYQFGYRYSVDLTPLLIFFAAMTYKKLSPLLIPIGLFSVAINVYGAMLFYQG